MKVRIAKDFYWEMSHRLPFHNGLCKNIHGHSYKLRVIAEGEPDANGILVDYYEIGRIVKPLIEEMDHSFAIDKGDEVMWKVVTENNFRYFRLPGYSTSESLSQFFLETFLPEFRKYPNISRLSIRVYETDDAYAEVTADIS